MLLAGWEIIRCLSLAYRWLHQEQLSWILNTFIVHHCLVRSPQVMVSPKLLADGNSRHQLHQNGFWIHPDKTDHRREWMAVHSTVVGNFEILPAMNVSSMMSLRHHEYQHNCNYSWWLMKSVGNAPIKFPYFQIWILNTVMHILWDT